MALTYFRATYTLVGLDTSLPVTGNVYARPNVHDGGLIDATGAVPDVTVLPSLKTGYLSNGVVTDSDDNQPGLKLIAGVGVTLPVVLRYKISFTNVMVGPELVYVRPFVINASTDGMNVDLTTARLDATEWSTWPEQWWPYDLWGDWRDW